MCILNRLNVFMRRNFQTLCLLLLDSRIVHGQTEGQRHRRTCLTTRTKKILTKQGVKQLEKGYIRVRIQFDKSSLVVLINILDLFLYVCIWNFVKMFSFRYHQSHPINLRPRLNHLSFHMEQQHLIRQSRIDLCNSHSQLLILNRSQMPPFFLTQLDHKAICQILYFNILHWKQEYRKV